MTHFGKVNEGPWKRGITLETKIKFFLTIR